MKPALTLLCGAALLVAANTWESKDYTQWSGEDVNHVLTDSPWAKKAVVSFDRSGGGGGRRGGGMGMPGGGMGMPGGGMGMPGGGGGMPGGGGMGMPGGGGMGMPGGGGGMGRGGGMGPGMGGDRNPIGTVQWQSALPVQQALLRSKFPDKTPGPGDPNYTLDAPQKDYVIAVSGLRMPLRRQESDDSSSDPDSPDSSRPAPNPDRMRSQLMGTSHLVVKNHAPIDAEDVKIDISAPENPILIYFPRTQAIGLDDKEVTFETALGPMKVERKFNVKDMKYQGKLAL